MASLEKFTNAGFSELRFSFFGDGIPEIQLFFRNQENARAIFRRWEKVNKHDNDFLGISFIYPPYPKNFDVDRTHYEGKPYCFFHIEPKFESIKSYDSFNSKYVAVSSAFFCINDFMDDENFIEFYKAYIQQNEFFVTLQIDNPDQHTHTKHIIRLKSLDVIKGINIPDDSSQYRHFTHKHY